MKPLDDAIADVSEVSGYFHLYTGPPRDEGRWEPLTALLEDRAAFADRIDDTAARLGTQERRVAASILYQGIAARLWSPVLGAVVLHGIVLDWTTDTVHWTDAPGGPLPLRLPSPAALRTGDPARLIQRQVTTMLDALTNVTLSVVKLERRLLWGNAASALAGAVGAVARERPAHTSEAIALGRALLGRPPLTDLGRLTEAGFTRRTCCLFYRIPGAGKCGDCALTS